MTWTTWSIPTSGPPGALKVNDLVSVEGREGAWKVGSVHSIAGEIYYGLWSPSNMFCAAMAKDCTEYIENKYSDEDWI